MKMKMKMQVTAGSTRKGCSKYTCIYIYIYIHIIIYCEIYTHFICRVKWASSVKGISPEAFTHTVGPTGTVPASPMEVF